MQLFSKRVREDAKKLSRDIDVAIFTQDEEHACVIVESDLRTVRVFVAGEPEFAEKARSYGFKAPTVKPLGPQ